MAAAEQNPFNDAKAAIEFIYGDEIQNRLYAEIDLDTLEHAAEVLNTAIDLYDYPTENDLIHHQALIHSTIILNFARIEVDQSVHLDQLEEALEKVDALLEKNPNITDFGNLLFESGHIARFLLDDPRLGYKYWHLCAQQAHAGCMNILAFNYFTGGYGIRQDIEKSYYWHNQTYLTGINFHCAGVYSARKARGILFLFPELSERKQWQDWTPEIMNLIEQLEEEYSDDNANMCGKGQVLLHTYLYELYENNTRNLALLKQANDIFIAAEPNHEASVEVAAFNLIGKPDFFEKSLGLLESIQDPFTKCNIGFSHILYARALKQTHHADAIFSMMSALDSEVCNESLTTIEYLRTRGTW
ncbi:hypothetical protein [Aliiglaciecola lipolytica]|uniref:Uncharacterized protein n=1 Tax=Aliiglaciecola lipolytica E3 TaxID=1127673 RepID=K6YVX5_9ALTE|nr:hypothetical protein [Aliiglaciecola lipolytica]GAC15400.1 hypothetical protein GLIP_2779 [Aliiglaciecola lipolytica E3]